MAVFLFLKLNQTASLCLQFECYTSLKGKLVGGEKEKEIASSPEKKSVKGKTFYESRDTLAEEKSLSSEQGSQKAGGRRERTTGMLVGIKGKHLVVAWCGDRGGRFTDQHHVCALYSSLGIISPEEGGYFRLYSNEFVYYDFSMTPSHACMEKVQADSPEKLFPSLYQVS